MKLLSLTHIRKKWNIILTEFVRRTRIFSSRSPEKWVEIRWSTKKYIAWMLPERSRRRAPERPWDRRRPSRTIYKPAVPTSSPGTLVSFRSSPAPFLRLWGSRFFTPRLILRMNLRETSSTSSASCSPFIVPTPREIAARSEEKRLRLIEIEFYSFTVHVINVEKKLFYKDFSLCYVSTLLFLYMRIMHTEIQQISFIFCCYLTCDFVLLLIFVKN